jgi:hypothetical protein
MMQGLCHNEHHAESPVGGIVHKGKHRINENIREGSGNMWKVQERLGSMWKLIEVHGSIRKGTEGYGRVRNIVEASGSFWKQLETSGNTSPSVACNASQVTVTA